MPKNEEMDLSNVMGMLNSLLSDSNSAEKMKNMLSQVLGGNSEDQDSTGDEQENNENENENNNEETNFNFDMLNKIQQISSVAGSFNQKQTKLLHCIKPYLSQNRQKRIEKIGEIIKLIGIIKLMKTQN